MKTHDNRVLFSKALLKAATCLFLTAGAGMSPVFALPGTAESMKMEITQQTVTCLLYTSSAPMIIGIC